MTTQADAREAVLSARLLSCADCCEPLGEGEWYEAECAMREAATALTELRAECERLRGEMAQAQHRHALAMESKHTAWELAIEQRDIAEARLEAAEARADAAERDAARLDWIERVMTEHGKIELHVRSPGKPANVRQAIDTALKDHP